MQRMKMVALFLVLLVCVGIEAQTSTPTTDSEISVDTGNGYGSTGVYVRSFTNVVANVGTAISYTADTTNGDYFTINADGVYAVSYTDGTTTGDVLGISVNGASTTALNSLASARVLCQGSIPAGYIESCSATLALASGDVVRAHRTVGRSLGTNDNNIWARFIITRVR